MPRHSAGKPSPPTPTAHPSSDGNSITSHQSHSIEDNATTPPPLKLLPPPPTPPPKSTSSHAREDCWSEDATFTLITAWGERFLQLNRGNLRQNHWQEVADAVNSCHGHVKKTRRTDIQCKNRIDTLKKKYKLEKSKILELGFHNYTSSWPFFTQLDSLIGSIFKPLKPSTQTPTPPPPHRKRLPAVPALPPPPSSVPVGRRSKRPLPPVVQPLSGSSFFRRSFSAMAAAAAAADGGYGGSDTSWSSRSRRRRWRNECRKGGEGDGYGEVAEAIGRFAEVYARVEDAKQRQMVEFEKQRMKFMKDLEIQRMKMLMESRMQLERLKRLKSGSDADFHRIDEEDNSTSVN